MYNQVTKINAREQLISDAITALTVDRSNSYVIGEKNLDKILLHFKELFHSFLVKCESTKIDAFDEDLEKCKQNWNVHTENHINKKKASGLKVLYLSGPEPQNDINVFLKYGILINNIWAIESDKKIYESALQNLIDTGLHIKLHRGTLREFFEQTNHEFDIIYFDACSPIISPKNDPVATLKEIFSSKRLSPLSALITNFSEAKENYNWGKLLAPWFATRNDDELPRIDYKCKLEGNEKAYSIEKYGEYIDSYIDEYYDKFITHFIPTLAGEIIPLHQVISIPSVQRKYFLEDSKLVSLFNEIKNNTELGDNLKSFFKTISHFKLAINGYPLLNWVRLSKDVLDTNHSIVRFIDSKTQKISIEQSMYIGSLIKRYEESNYGFNTYTDEVCSPLFKEIIDKLNYFDREIRLTCDIPMKNLIIEFLFGIYGFPYIANTNKTYSYKYKAKKTLMYSNVFIFDQCRSLYDFIPSIEIFTEFFKSIPNQMIIRSGIDCIRRNHLYLNSNIFKWGLIEGVDEKFGWFELKERQLIE